MYHNNKKNKILTEKPTYEKKTTMQKIMTLMEENSDRTNGRRDIQYTWIARIDTVKRSIQPKQSVDSMQFLSNNQWYFSENQNKTFTICMQKIKTMTSKRELEKEKHSWSSQAP